MPVHINWEQLGAVALPHVGSIGSGIFIRKALPWYNSLKKPSWNPPNYGFAIAWTTIYTSIGYASYLVYKEGGGFNGAAKVPLIVYGSNLLLNWSWTPIFFWAKRIDIALYEIQLINATTLAAGYLFYKINPVAGYLFIPYYAWLGVATLLNYVIWRDNKDGAKIKELKD